MDDDLMAFDRGIEVRDDADNPLVGPFWQPLGLRRCAVLAADAERARVPLLLRFGLDPRTCESGTGGAARRDDHRAARDRVVSQLRRDGLSFPSAPALSEDGLISSIGAGKTIDGRELCRASARPVRRPCRPRTPVGDPRPGDTPRTPSGLSAISHTSPPSAATP